MTCVVYGIEIPDGKHYCRNCWATEMQTYRDYKADYDAKVAEWKSLSHEERAAINDEEKEKSLRFRTILFFVFIAFALAVVGLVMTDSQSNLIKAYILFGLAVVLLIAGIILAIKSPLFRRIFGKAFSSFIGAFVGAFVGIFIADVVAKHYGWITGEAGLGAALDALFSSDLSTVQWLSLGASLAIPTLLGGFIGFRYTVKIKFYPPGMPSQSGNRASPGHIGTWDGKFH